MIKLHNINVKFDNLKVLSDINLVINEGEITTILGPSGSGKTTILRCIAGLHKSFNGTITIQNTEQKEYLKKSRIAVVNQSYSSFPWMNVKSNIAVGAKRQNNKSSIYSIDQVIESIGLKGFENYYPNQLSGGMKQRVAIGRAIIQGTDVLVFDEPFGALDYQTRLQLQQLIKKIRNDFGKTIVFVTHDIEEALFISDKVVVLSKSPSIIVEEIIIPENLKVGINSSVRYENDFITLRLKIENIISNLSVREDIENIFKTRNYHLLSKLNIWNTFLTNECRKYFCNLNIKEQKAITLELLNSKSNNAIAIGSLLLPENESEEINNKLTKLLYENNDYELKYFLIHAITRLKNLSAGYKEEIKNLVYDNLESHVYFDRKYYTANNIYGDKVVINLLESHLIIDRDESYLKNKSWLLLISTLAHSDTNEIIEFLSNFINDKVEINKKTAKELLEKIENNEIDFEKIRQ